LTGAVPGDHERVVRQKVRDTLTDLAKELPADLRRAAECAFALDPDAPARLSKRTEQLAEAIHCGERTARRRMDEAVHLMARAADTGPGPVVAGDPGSGWRVRSLFALLRLDTPTPELYETRTIVANQPLAELVVRLDLPPPSPNDNPALPLVIDALYGSRIKSVERRNEGRHYRLTIALPRVLQPDDQLDFCLHYRIPEGQPIRDHYAIVPLDPCDYGTVRARFSGDRPPAAVWRLSAVPPRLLDEATAAPGPDRLELDGVGEVVLAFRGLREGYGYGVAWQPA
jgi:hypothetical protein